MNDRNFIVRTAKGQFVQDIDYNERVIDITVVPSFAKFFTYDDAAKLSNWLRTKQELSEAVVCDLAGRVMTYNALSDYRRRSLELEKQLDKDEARIQAFVNEGKKARDAQQ